MIDQTATLAAPVAGATPAAVADAERERSQVIDALRAVAALGVLGFHAQLLAMASVSTGLPRSLGMTLDIGVELFFVISGLLITAPFVRALIEGRAAPDLGSYAIRRVLRILPAYWLVLLSMALVFGFHRQWWEWLLHFTLLQSPVPGQIGRILPTAWTLHVELVFYLLVPVAYLALRHRAPLRPETLARWLVGLYLASSAFLLFVAATTGGDNEKALGRSVPATIGLFCPGILLVLAGTRAGAATAMAARWRSFLHSRTAAVLVAVLAVICVALSGAENIFLQELRRPPEAILAGLLVALALDAGPRLRRAARWLAPLGTISYSVYLWHFPLMAKLLSNHLAPGPSFGKARLPLAAVELAAVSLPLAAISYLLVERPAMRWSHRLRRIPRPHLATVSAAVPR